MKRTTFLMIIICVFMDMTATEYPSFYETIKPQLNNQVIEIPQGTYAYDLDNPDPLIKFTEKKNVQINGNGSTIICSKPGGVFRFDHCENITISGFTFDCYPRTSTQGTITNISGADNRTLEVEIHDGYTMVDPDDASTYSCVLLYDKDTRELLRNFHTAAIQGDIIADNENRKVTFKISYLINHATPPYEIGDYVTFSSFPNGYGNHLFEADFCKDMKYENITVHDTRGATFGEICSENSHYYRCVVDRKLNDPLYGEEQLRTTSGDIVHSLFATKGPKIEECTFKHMCDDGANITGFFYTIYKTVPARKRIYLLISSDAWWIFSLKVGDTLVCIGNDGSIQGKTKVTAIDKPSAEPTDAEIKACTDKLGNMKSKDALKYGMSIQVEDWIDELEIAGMVYPENRVGNGFQIINSYMGNNRSRGALVKASNGLIKGNTFKGAALAGLVIAPEYYWMESGISNNVEITENLIEDCMFNEDQYKTGQLAGLSVVSEAPKSGLTRTPVFENIIIHRNIIRGCPKPSVFLNAMSGYYYKNTIEPNENMVRNHGSLLGVPNSDAYVQMYCGTIIRDEDPLLVNIKSASKDDELIRVDENGVVSFNGINNGSNYLLTVYNILGKSVMSDTFEKSSSVSLNNLNKGIYIINVKCADKSYSKKHLVK